LENEHEVKNEADANAYLDSLNALGKGVAQENELLRSDVASFGLMPDFLLKSTLAYLKGFVEQDVLTHPLTLGLEVKARKAGLGAGWGRNQLPCLKMWCAHSLSVKPNFSGLN